MRIRRSGLLGCVAMILIACLVRPASTAEGLRRVQVGEILPEFSLTDVNGVAFAYKQGQGRALGIIVLQAGHGNSERVLADVGTLVRELRAEGPAFDCVGVVSGPDAREFIRTHCSAPATPLFMAPDPNFAFWGRLGVIAAPTAVVVGSDGRVQWLRAGYGYDFTAGLRAQLRKALGLAGGDDVSVHVETLENASARARRERHVQLARILARKGRAGSAADELQKAHDLDPNATEIALELGEMLCRAGRNEEALKVATEVKTKTGLEKARSLSICGWARRQMKQLNDAETLLKSALELNPRSARVLYELGLVYESSGNTSKALECYRRALAETFEEAPSASSSHE